MIICGKKTRGIHAHAITHASCRHARTLLYFEGLLRPARIETVAATPTTTLLPLWPLHNVRERLVRGRDARTQHAYSCENRRLDHPPISATRTQIMHARCYTLKGC